MRFLAALPLVVALAVPTSPAAVLGPEPVADSPSPRADLVAALRVLHAWDARRARAWSDVDAGALGRLYVAGSLAGRADVRLLRAYAGRGLVVDRLVTQVFAVRVLHRDAATLRVRVLDRVAGGTVLDAGEEVGLPSSPPVTRTVVFRLVEGGWRVAAVSGSGSAPRGARR